MDTLVAMALAVAALAVAIAVLVDVRRGRRDQELEHDGSWLDDTLRTRILVQTRDGQTIEGALVRIDADGIVLDPARYENQDLAGVAWIPRERIAWIQEPDASR